MENYLTPEELRAVAYFSEALQPLWNALVNGPRDGITIEIADGIEVEVYDSNGEKLGVLAWSDSGPAFYPASTND